MYDDRFTDGYIVGASANNGNGFGNNAWGGDWAWIIILFLIFGWGGNNGFGGGFGGFGGGNNMAFDLGRLATTNDVASGFSTSEIMSDLNDILLQNSQGFANVQQTLCQGFNGINTALLTGFHGVDNAVCTLGYQNQAGFNSLGHQISDCCCNIRTELLQNRFFNEKQTCDLITNANANTQRIIDFMVNEKMSAKDARIASLEAQISNDRQSRYIVDALSPKCPQPAYVVQPPQEVTFPTNCCGNVAYANYNTGNCGCGL